MQLWNSTKYKPLLTKIQISLHFLLFETPSHQFKMPVKCLGVKIIWQAEGEGGFQQKSLLLFRKNAE